MGVPLLLVPHAGYYINLGPYVLYVDDYSIAQDNNVQYVASTNHVLLTPALFGASAVLKTPSTMTLRLPATSSLPASPTAAQCNAALQLFSPAGASRSSPIATCALGPDASSVDLVLAASYVYGNGETINAGPANAVLRYASADGPAYAPADDNLPILTTLASATLESLTSMTVRLPTPSVLPANLSDCATVLVFGANKTLTSCALTPDGTAISATIPATTYAAGARAATPACLPRTSCALHAPHLADTQLVAPQVTRWTWSAARATCASSTWASAPPSCHVPSRCSPPSSPPTPPWPPPPA